MTIGIKSIASYIPPNSVDNVQQAQSFGDTEDFIKNKIGAFSLPKKEATQETSDLAVLAVQNLLKKCPQLNVNNIDALIVVTQNPDGQGLPHTAAIVQKKLGLPTTIAAFDISLGCSGYVYGLYAIKGFLEASGLKNGILVTADPYSKVINPSDKVTSLLFGDAATATWIGENPAWELHEVAYGTNGEGAEYLKVTENQLYMNGRQVFMFALSQVSPHIKALLQKANMPLESIDMYCVHQGSAAIVDAVANSFGELSNRFIKDLTTTGNTISSSIPIVLEKHLDEKAHQNVLVCGFGVGMSWASAILKKALKQ